MTPTPRERFEWIHKFDEMIDKEWPIEWQSSTDRRNVFNFIETLLEEAEARWVQKGREEMKEKLKEAIIKKEKELCHLFTSNNHAVKVILEESFNSIYSLGEWYTRNSSL